MIKTIIFDNNGVLTTNDAEGTLKNVSELFGVAEEELKTHFFAAAEGLDDGSITTPEFYQILMKRLGKNCDLADLQKVHLGSYQPKTEVVEFVKRLKNDYRLALLTNFGDYFDLANEQWQLNEIFLPENMFVSAKIKMRKPNENIYRYVLEKLGEEPGETLFVDDRIENLIPAEKIGIKTVLFQDLESLVTSLKKESYV